MKKIFILSALISFTIFTSCHKEEIAEEFVPAEEELVAEEELITSEAEKYADNSAMLGQSAFTIDHEDNTLYESDELLLTNNSVNAVSYHWDFGNGDVSTEANPTYKNYKIHGPFTITLTVTDARGKTHQTSQEVLVLCVFGGAPHPF